MNEIRYAGEPLLLAPGSAFVCPWGKTPGRGTFEADARSLSRIKQKLEQSGGSAKLVMTDGAHSLTLEPIFLVSAEPVVTRRGAPSPGQDVASWRVTLADRRRVLRMKTISGRWNVLGPDRENYLGGSPLSWQDLVTLLADALGFTELTVVGEPAGTPINVWWDSVPALDHLDELLAEIGQYLTYNPLADVWAVRKVGSVDADDQADLDDLLMEFRIEGASAEKLTRPCAPASVDVLFPIHDTALADVRTAPEDRWYAVNRTAPEGLKTVPGTKATVHFNHAYAIRVEGEVTNAEALATIAAARAAEFYAPFAVTHADYELAGLHPLAPNSLIRRVIWVSDEEGARTFVRVHNPSLAEGRLARPDQRRDDGGPSLTEGDGIFIQRGIRRARIECDRWGFMAKVTEHVTGAEYKVRRTDRAGNWIGAPLGAYHYGGESTVEDDTPVWVFTDGKGDYVFAPFDRAKTVAFAGSCRIDHANPGSPDPNETSCENQRTSAGGGAPDANTEEYLLLKLERPVEAPGRIIVPLELAVRWGVDCATKPFIADCGHRSRFRWITEDFDYEGGSCATWNTAPAVTGSVDRDVRDTVGAVGGACNVYHQNAPSVFHKHVFLADLPAETVIYGVQLEPVQWSAIKDIFTDVLQTAQSWMTADVSGGLVVLE